MHEETRNHVNRYAYQITFARRIFSIGPFRMLKLTTFILACLTFLTATGCSDLNRVDVRANDMLKTQNSLLADGPRNAPQIPAKDLTSGTAFPKDTPETNQPASVDPRAEELPFSARSQVDNQSQAIIDRIQAMAETPANARRLTLEDSLAYAQINSTEYSGAEETYLLTALSLIIREHEFEPRFFNETSAAVGFRGDQGSANFGGNRYKNSLRVSNDFGVRQKLPYGGEVTARMIANITQNLDSAAQDNGQQGAQFVINAAIPLLEGAGLSARENLIQAKRNLVYAARSFETFRRDFYVAIVSDYLDLVFRRQAIINAERGVELNRQVEARETALVQAGRQQPFEADLARARTLFALDDLSAKQEAYRLALDRFKVRIGMNTEEPISIPATEIQFPIPDVTKNQGVIYALEFRLDLQTARDQLEDTRRQIDIAENALLPSLELRGNARASGPETDSGLSFQAQSSSISGGIFFSAPLDKMDQNVRLRQSQLVYGQAERALGTTLDQAALEVRRAIREIDRAQFSLLIAERNVEIANNRIEKIDAAPDRASARDRTDSVSDLRDSEDSRDLAKKNLQIAILQYLRTAGILRVTPNGNLQPLPNMPVGEVIESASKG